MLPWPEQPAAVRIRHRHAAEVRAVDAADAVVPREPLVDERVVGVRADRAPGGSRGRCWRNSSSVSRRIAWRTLSSKSGNSSTSGVTLSRLRSCSHWPVNAVISASARGSAIIRRTCASSTPGARSRPAIARFSSSSSGMLLQRKNDSRLASSSSVTRCGVPAGRLAGSLSERNRKAGLVRIRARPVRMPASKSPPAARSSPVQRHRRVDVRLRHRPPERAARHRGQDLLRARRFLRRRFRRADEQALP